MYLAVTSLPMEWREGGSEGRERERERERERMLHCNFTQPPTMSFPYCITTENASFCGIQYSVCRCVQVKGTFPGGSPTGPQTAFPGTSPPESPHNEMTHNPTRKTLCGWPVMATRDQ